MKKDIEELFMNASKHMAVHKENILVKIRNACINIFFGKNKYKRMLLNYENNILRDVKIKVDKRSAELDFTVVGILEQMREVKRQINTVYLRTVTNQMI